MLSLLPTLYYILCSRCYKLSLHLLTVTLSPGLYCLFLLFNIFSLPSYLLTFSSRLYLLLLFWSILSLAFSHLWFCRLLCDLCSCCSIPSRCLLIHSLCCLLFSLSALAVWPSRCLLTRSFSCILCNLCSHCFRVAGLYGQTVTNSIECMWCAQSYVWTDGHICVMALLCWDKISIETRRGCPGPPLY